MELAAAAQEVMDYGQLGGSVVGDVGKTLVDQGLVDLHPDLPGGLGGDPDDDFPAIARVWRAGQVALLLQTVQHRGHAARREPGQAYNLNGLGVVYQLQGRHDQALACLRNSIAIRRELGDPYGEAESLRDLGVVLRALDRPQEARAHWLAALAIFERLRTADADQIRLLLADLPAQPPRAACSAGG
jgi:tetratricopeptide (TPR) repeat protein